MVWDIRAGGNPGIWAQSQTIMVSSLLRKPPGKIDGAKVEPFPSTNQAGDTLVTSLTILGEIYEPNLTLKARSGILVKYDRRELTRTFAVFEEGKNLVIVMLAELVILY